MLLEGFGNKAGERIPIYGQRAARGHPRPIRRRHYQRIQMAHFFLEQAHGVLQPIRSQRIGTDQLRKQGRMMGRAHGLGLLLDQRDGNAPPDQLPGGFAARQARADNGYAHSSSSVVCAGVTSTRWRQVSLLHRCHSSPLRERLRVI